MKPKRGKSSQKQKKRLAMKLDKVRTEPGNGKVLALQQTYVEIGVGLTCLLLMLAGSGIGGSRQDCG